MDQGERGTAFLSRDPGLNTTFGAFFISLGQRQRTASTETFVYHTSPREFLAGRANYTMRWLLAGWIIRYGNNYVTSPSFGGFDQIDFLGKVKCCSMLARQL